MADDEGSGLRSRGKSFLSKSKWGKVFKENDSPPVPSTASEDFGQQQTQAKHTNSFKLNEDVVDFLKPSTEKSKPKLDIAIAQRWPEAHEVRGAREREGAPLAAGHGQQQQQVQGKEGAVPQWTGYRRRRRREGLTVGFVKTTPDVIGEGGDEAPDPPAEISRRKAMVSRSASAYRPNTLDNGTSWPGAVPLPRPGSGQVGSEPRPGPGLVRAPQEDFTAPPLRRADTSHNEFSPPVQRKFASPPIEAIAHRPSLGRTPTGFSDDMRQQQQRPVNEADYESDEEIAASTESGPPRLDTQAPMIGTNFHFDSPQPMTASTVNSSSSKASAAPRDPSSPLVVRRRDRDMQAYEGMALRRASTLFMQDEGQEQRQPDSATGLRPSEQFYNTLSNLSVSRIVSEEERGVAGDDLSPEGTGPSPFEDPRYMKRRSGDTNLQGTGQSTQPPVQTIPQQVPIRQHPGPGQRSHDMGPPSYMRAGQQGASQSYDEPRQQPSQDMQPSYMRAGQRPGAQSYDETHRRPSEDTRPSYMRAAQPPNGSAQPGRPPPAPAQTMQVPSDDSASRSRSPMRNRIFDSQTSPEKQKPRPFYNQSSNSSGSINRFPASSGMGASSHSRTSSREETSPQIREPNRSQTSPEQRFGPPRQSPQSPSPRSSMLGPGNAARGATSPYARGPSPAGYFAGSQNPAMQGSRPPAATLRSDDAVRPGSAASSRSFQRPIPSPQPSTQSDPATDLALADFAGRVAHMRGVFSLTAEKERPVPLCSPQAWLRTALWWYLKGKAGLEVLLQQRSKASEPPRELLMQCHVDLAKAWWFLSEHLDEHTMVESPQSVHSPAGHSQLSQSSALLRSHIKSLCASMQKAQLMPPHQSLIQGQDTRIWIDYPRFTSNVVEVLSGAAIRSILVDPSTPTTSPIEALPLGDTRGIFCFGRFPVEASINTDEAETDRAVFPCMLTMLRNKREFQPSIVVAGQSDLVNVNIGPRRGDEKGLGWQDVSWKAGSHGLSVHLPRGFDLTVKMQERDFRSLWNMVEYARKIEHSLRPREDERQAHESLLAELQYADSSGTHSFPAEKMPRCMALVFERTLEHRDGSGARKMHRGFRLLLVTDPAHKSLSSVSHNLGAQSPLLFEFITDAAAQGTTAMVLRIREENRQCRILLVFPDMASRQALYDILNGLSIGEDEAIVSKIALTGLNIQNAAQISSSSPISSHPALQSFQWQKLGITNSISDDPNTRIAPTVGSESLRLVARHAAGCITDRLNLGKGELLFRLPCAAQAIPAIQILREPQEDLTMSIDVRQASQEVVEGVSTLYQLAQQQTTVRTLLFATPADLHTFQASVTGFTVAYDGVASTFNISHRMAMVPIYQKKQASSVRLQIVQNAHGNTTQVLAFMEDFELADALCFQIRSTDTFERVKGDGRGKKWGVKFVDAKFKLNRLEKRDGDEEVEVGERVRRRFVNLEGLEYAEEHDDIGIGFETEADRDRFAAALPAATTVGRLMTLKRRI
ncbi:hypothetical protein LTR78_003530 [Recurvomyces mirabilis]|uniref:Uncharacterized protein n=1 Tax=Recurvomyces mirabilis TaxID=574656 RepID=A0AAE0WS05_9PEZI|nr:hypothetical protein LTR78_003530 [Recurvomyces mirabilis]KAK5154439.1 hypothetical protein LTS14_006574 [Recurvomyces mirabilis]